MTIPARTEDDIARLLLLRARITDVPTCPRTNEPSDNCECADDDVTTCTFCGAVGPWATWLGVEVLCYSCSGVLDHEPETPCECCGQTGPCDCDIVPCPVELISDDRGVVWGTGRGCATHRTEV